MVDTDSDTDDKADCPYFIVSALELAAREQNAQTTYIIIVVGAFLFLASSVLTCGPTMSL